MKRKALLLQIPDILTLANLLMGFTAIIFVMHSDYSKAALFIILAIILDMSDGFFSRRFKSSSRFGLELDSLADLVSFGVAPGVLVYGLLIPSSGSVVLAAIIPLFGAVRLARYNIIEDHDSFTGLPTPAVGGFIAALVLAGVQLQTYPAVVWIIVLSLLMVSEVPFPRYRRISSKKTPRPLIILVLSLIPPLLDFRLLIVPFITYVTLGLTIYLWGRSRIEYKFQ